jgi:hypothetical protein
MLTFDLSLRVDRLDAPTLTNITEITSHNQFPGRSGAQTLALGGATSCWAFVAWLELEAKRTNFLENINAALDFDYGSTHLENWQANNLLD